MPGKAWALLIRTTLSTGAGVRPSAAALTATYETLTTMASGALLAALVEAGTINRAIARGLLADIFQSGRSPGELVKERGLAVIRDESALEKAIDEAIAANPKVVADYLGGKENALMALIGPVMRATRGQADANTVRELLKRKLELEPDADESAPGLTSAGPKAGVAPPPVAVPANLVLPGSASAQLSPTPASREDAASRIDGPPAYNVAS